jgi:hypothetical protein
VATIWSLVKNYNNKVFSCFYIMSPVRIFMFMSQIIPTFHHTSFVSPFSYVSSPTYITT